MEPNAVMPVHLGVSEQQGDEELATAPSTPENPQTPVSGSSRKTDVTKASWSSMIPNFMRRAPASGGEVSASIEVALAHARLLPCMQNEGLRRSKSLHAKPQRSAGKDVWPENWGLTKGQVSDLLQRLRRDPKWCSDNSVYKMVTDFIIPWTKGKGVGYALLVNEDAPKEVNAMVSHAWAENAEEFLDTLLRSTDTSDVVFVCALSLYQAEDDAGPSVSDQISASPDESPFRRVLAHIDSKRQAASSLQQHGSLLFGLPSCFLMLGVIIFYFPIVVYGCVPTFTKCWVMGPRYHAHERLQILRDIGLLASVSDWFPCTASDPSLTNYPWMTVLSLVLSAVSRLMLKCLHVYRGRMIVIPNREMDIYSRLWCIYEIYITSTLKVPVALGRTLAAAGRVSSRKAKCTSAEDARQIRNEIEASELGYDGIDKVVHWVTFGAGWEAVRVSCVHGVWLATVNLAAVQLACSDDWSEKLKLFLLFIPGFLLASLLSIAVVYLVVAKYSHGQPTRCQIWTLFLGLLIFAACFRLLGRVVDWPAGYIGRAPVIIAFHVLIASYLQRCLPRRNLLRKRTFLLVLVFSSMLLVSLVFVLDMMSASAAPTTTAGQDDLVQLAEGWYPSIVRSVTAVTSTFGGPAFICWSIATSWGVRVI